MSWRDLHYSVIVSFMQYLRKCTDKYVLKGGTSLMLCYSLDRFSEDIDLDAWGTKLGLERVVSGFCTENNYSYRVGKNTDTVKRYFIHYGSGKPLRVEISYRVMNSIQDNDVCIMNNILVYNISRLLAMKLSAYQGRDRIRDLYDVVFICLRYYNLFSEYELYSVRNAFSIKGLEHYDYLVATQKDDLVNVDKLGNDFIELYYMLGLS